MKNFFSLLAVVFHFAAFAQTPSIESIDTLLANANFEAAFKQSQSLLLQTPKDSAQQLAKLRYQAIQAGSGMVIQHKITREELQKFLSGFVGKLIAFPPQPFGDDYASLKNFRLVRRDSMEYAMSVSLNNNKEGLTFQFFTFNGSVPSQSYQGYDVAATGELKSVEVKSTQAKWVTQLTITGTELKAVRPSEKQEEYRPAMVTTFDSTPATHTFYYTDRGLLSQNQADSLVKANQQRYRGAEVKLRITGRTVRNDTALLHFALNIELKDSEEFADLEVLEQRKNLKKFVGKRLPKFRFRDMEGMMVNSRKLKGKPVVINFWFTTCPPCVAEMPALNKIKSEYADSDVVFLSMTFETAEKVNTFLQKKEFNYQTIPNVHDYIRQFTRLYPVTLFINRDGRVVQFMGGMPMVSPIRAGHGGEVDDSEFRMHLTSIAGPSFVK